MPKGHVPRKAILDGIKRSLFALGLESAEEDGAKGRGLGMEPGPAAVGRDEATLLVQGMGGSGKTVAASSVARNAEVGARFGVICFVGVGQDADLRELQRSLHFQLVQSVMETSLREEEAAGVGELGRRVSPLSIGAGVGRNRTRSFAGTGIANRRSTPTEAPVPATTTAACNAFGLP